MEQSFWIVNILLNYILDISNIYSISICSIVTDLHAILEVNVLDEDKNKVYEFLGKLEIPIINVSFTFIFSKAMKQFTILLI